MEAVLPWTESGALDASVQVKRYACVSGGVPVGVQVPAPLL